MSGWGEGCVVLWMCWGENAREEKASSDSASEVTDRNWMGTNGERKVEVISQLLEQGGGLELSSAEAQSQSTPGC